MSHPMVAASLATALMLSSCGSEPTAAPMSAPSATQSGQPDTVVTSRSGGKAIPNPRRGSFKKSDPNQPAGYRSPD